MNPLVENKIIEVMERVTGVQCYLDVVPNKAQLPACTITSIGESPINTRNLSGDKVGNGTEHRVSLVAGSMPELEKLVNDYRMIDNTFDEYFQKIQTDFSSREPYDGETAVFRVFYNLTVIPR